MDGIFDILQSSRNGEDRSRFVTNQTRMCDVESSERNLCPMEVIVHFTILSVARKNNAER
jgi:hypothetical protein